MERLSAGSPPARQMETRSRARWGLGKEFEAATVT